MEDVSPHGLGNVFTCSFADCGKFFHKRSRLLIHLRSHTGERPYVCSHEDCVKSYGRSSHLKRHLESAHSNPDEPSPKVRVTYRCPYEDCGLMVACQWNLNQHIRRRHESQKYVCQVEDCGKRCKSDKQLKRHERLKHSVDEFKCSNEECGKVFNCESRLKAHQKMHEGYKCMHEGCTETLSTWTLFRKHMAIAHKDLSVLECRICNKKFVNKANLKMHMMVHSENRPVFECPREKCGRVYLDRRNLTAHVRSYHDGKRVPCTHEGCTQSFFCKNKMLLHLPLHDPNRPLPKKKRKKKPAGTRESGGPLKKKRRKRRPRENMAASLCGLEGHSGTGDAARVSVSETDEDKVVLSESDTEAGCKVVTGWKLLLPISDPADSTKKEKKQKPPNHGTESVKTTTQIHNSDNVGEKKKEKKRCPAATVASAEAEVMSELSQSLVRGPSLPKTRVMSSSESDLESTMDNKSSVLKIQELEKEDSQTKCPKGVNFDSECKPSLPKDSSGPVVAWDIIAFSKSSVDSRGAEDPEGVDDEPKEKKARKETRVDIKRCIILEDIPELEKCRVNTTLCFPVGEHMLDSELSADNCKAVVEEENKNLENRQGV